MKYAYGILLALACAGIVAGDGLTCTLPVATVPHVWLDMVDPCINAMKEQVSTEIKASLTYMAMGAYFARDSVNRLGFSKLFFDSASEEREHAMKIIEYLLMRGQLTSNIAKLLKFPMQVDREEWNSGVDALSRALELEAEVTKSIRNIMKICEAPDSSNFNDYHLVDYLTTEFLDEQYKGERVLAGKISTLDKMMSTYGELGEFLFDKKLLNGEL